MIATSLFLGCSGNIASQLVGQWIVVRPQLPMGVVKMEFTNDGQFTHWAEVQGQPQEKTVKRYRMDGTVIVVDYADKPSDRVEARFDAEGRLILINQNDKSEFVCQRIPADPK